MAYLTFKSPISHINGWSIITLPKDASIKLPSRGMTMVKGMINNHPLLTPLEPDGRGSHWFKIDGTLLKALNVKDGDIVTLAIEPTKEWIEPDVPRDIEEAIKSSSAVEKVWNDITPMARWDWVRWINGTKQADTRKRRIEVALSKMKSGKRRPCCFNRNMCSVTDVSHNGQLISSI